MSGRVLLPIDPELHRQVAIAASLAGESLNGWVGRCLQRGVTSVKKARTPEQVAGEGSRLRRAGG